MTDNMFSTLLNLMKDPLRDGGGIKTDESILLVYPPEKDLDFREQLLDSFVPLLEARSIPYHLLDLTGFIFKKLSNEEIESLQQDEFDDYRWMLQSLSKRVEVALQNQLTGISRDSPGRIIIVFGTTALYPLVRFGEILGGLRNLNSRIVLAYPGEERGGKLHFMGQPDGGNYLAVKLFWR